MKTGVKWEDRLQKAIFKLAPGTIADGADRNKYQE